MKQQPPFQYYIIIMSALSMIPTIWPEDQNQEPSISEARYHDRLYRMLFASRS